MGDAPTLCSHAHDAHPARQLLLLRVPVHHLAKVAVLRQREEARHRLVDRLVAAVHLRVREHLLRAAAQLGERLGDRALGEG